MIHIMDWSSQVAKDLTSSSSSTCYDVTYTFSEKLDDRSDWSQQYITSISQMVKNVYYDPHRVSLNIDACEYGIQELKTYDIPNGKCLIDATTLPLPELLHLFSVFKYNKREFDVIYVQPSGYTEKEEEKGIDIVKSFDLSDDGLGLQQLPPFVGFSDNSSMFICLGFEGHRIGALIHSDEYNTKNATCLIGTPAFKLGWENTTLSNNYTQLSELSNNLAARFRFAGANDPLKTYDVIQRSYDSLNYENKTLCLAPFGTKPAAIAAAQFAVNNSGVTIAYDFVKKKNRRSKGTDVVHIWNFSHM